MAVWFGVFEEVCLLISTNKITTIKQAARTWRTAFLFAAHFVLAVASLRCFAISTWELWGVGVE